MQLTLFDDTPSQPWTGYGWITYNGRRLFALVYHTLGHWSATAHQNPGVLKRTAQGLVCDVVFGEQVEALTERMER